MKTIGLIGGISWVSTIDYYRLINQGINEKLGGLNFAQCLIYSFNYADIKKNNDANDWELTLKMISEAAEHLKNGGAEAIVLCANTMHLIAERLEERIGIPVIHIAVAAAQEVRKKNIRCVGLLGTKFTMEEDFFKSKLYHQQIRVMIPEPADREFIHNTIFDELGKGIVVPETQKKYLEIIDRMVNKGAEGVVLGCTEISLLVQQKDVAVPVFDTAAIHSKAAVEFSLS